MLDMFLLEEYILDIEEHRIYRGTYYIYLPKLDIFLYMGMDQYLLIPFLVGYSHP
jgi:hypothetical protein